MSDAVVPPIPESVTRERERFLGSVHAPSHQLPSYAEVIDEFTRWSLE